MRAILHKGDEADLRKGAAPAAGAGPAEASSLAGSSATSSVLPSMLTNRQSLYQAPRVIWAAIGRTTSSCSCCKGSHPSRERACEMPDFPATLTFTDGASHWMPSNKQRSTSR